MFSDRTNWKLSRNQLTETLDALHDSGTPVLDLTISNPTRCGFAYDANAIVDAFRQPQMLDYDPQAKGLLSARQAVADYYLQDRGAKVDCESISLTTSTSEAYSFVFRLLCNPHDEILVPQPSYPLFEFLADLQDVSLIPYSLQYAHSWFIDFQSLERALTPRTRAILLVHPNNPTGSYLRDEEVRRLNQICRERQLALIVDEVFLDYSFADARLPTLATNQECLTFTLSGLSKIAALPQMKAAWIAASGPASLVQGALERLDVIADTYLSLNAPTQLAFPALFEQRRSLQPQIRSRTLENRAYLQQQLQSRSAWSLLDAQGGWYAVLKMPPKHSDEDFAVRLLRDHHTLVHPGHFYNFSAENFLVLSLITPADHFREGITRLLNSSLTSDQ
jgi:aspartate/methionine/tyrosine aminotransferase